MERHGYHTVFDSDLHSIAKMVEEAMHYIQTNFCDLNTDLCFDMRLILSETLINAVVHGNKAQKDKKVIFSIDLEDNYTVVISVKDEGKGFNHAQFVERLKDSARIMSEGGRGIQLVHSLSDRIVFNDFGNEITIYKKVAVDG